MNQRNFPNFIAAYLDYADNRFAPRIFHLWSAISIVSAALGRKVWMRVSATECLYPNNYIFLVAKPGIGKSSALNKATGMIDELNESGGSVMKLPNSITEAKLIDCMSKSTSFTLGTTTKFHASGYFVASEASDSFEQKMGSGNLVAPFTNLYDCPNVWKRGTLKDDEIPLYNTCMNMIAGCTFDFLGKLVTNENIMGGFASRVIYIVHEEKLIRDGSLGAPEQHEASRDMRRKLLADLASIHQLVGEFRWTAEFEEVHKNWYVEFEEQRQNHPSEQMQSLLVRKHVNLKKVAMVLAIAESNDLVLKKHHFDQALALLDEAEAALPRLLKQSRMQGRGQTSLVQEILSGIGLEGTNFTDLKRHLICLGYDPGRVEQTFSMLLANKAIGFEGTRLKLLVNPDAYL